MNENQVIAKTTPEFKMILDHFNDSVNKSNGLTDEIIGRIQILKSNPFKEEIKEMEVDPKDTGIVFDLKSRINFLDGVVNKLQYINSALTDLVG